MPAARAREAPAPEQIMANVNDVLATAHFILTGICDRLGQLAVPHSRIIRQAPFDPSSSTRAPKMSSDNPSGTGTEGDGTTAMLTLEQQIEIQRTQIAKAMSTIEACRLGGDSMLAPIKRGSAGAMTTMMMTEAMEMRHGALRGRTLRRQRHPR